jgi:hypothetical protein
LSTDPAKIKDNYLTSHAGEFDVSGEMDEEGNALPFTKAVRGRDHTKPSMMKITFDALTDSDIGTDLDTLDPSSKNLMVIEMYVKIENYDASIPNQFLTVGYYTSEILENTG